MCGRFLLLDDVENEEIRKIIDEINSRYGNEEAAKLKKGEIFPTDYVPAIINDTTNKKIITLMKWGFPRPKGQGVIINARQETLEEKPTFKSILRYKRCLIPASGFYEWKHAEDKKDKYLIRTRKAAFYMAGLYNSFIDGNGASYHALVIITTDANEEMSHIHDRMPVIFHKEEGKLWLNPRADAQLEFKRLLAPYGDTLDLSKVD